MKPPTVTVVPFCPVTFNPDLADLSDLIAPPYDTIDDEICRSLLNRHPHNIVRLILPQTISPPSSDPYGAAARLWREWFRQKVLIESDEPSLFIYVQRFLWRGKLQEHRFLLGAMALVGYETGLVRPHEETMTRVKADRLKLLEATGVEFSQVHALLSDETGEWNNLLGEAMRGTEWLRVKMDGVEHFLWRLNDPEFLRGANHLLSSQWLVIADGHHRYETALAFQKRVIRKGDDADHPANFIGTLIADYQQNAMTLPTHRLLSFSEQEGVERVIGEVARRFPTVDAEWDGTEEGVERIFGDEKGIPFLFVAQGRVKRVLIRGIERELEEALRGFPPILRRVDTIILHRFVLPFVMAGAGIRKGTVHLSYTPDARVAKEFSEGEGRLAILVRATPPSLVRAIAQQGLRLPPKTTYFFPKAPSGLIMRRVIRPSCYD